MGRFIVLGGKDGEHFHRGVLGRFWTESEAKEFALELEGQGQIDWWLIQDKVSGDATESFESTSHAGPPKSSDLDTIPVLPLVADESSSTSSAWVNC